MPSLSARLKSRVVARANHCCEYCLTSQRTTGGQMHIEHIVPLAQGGASTPNNLCLSCAWCNTFKAASTHAFDPVEKRKVMLFNPRHEMWGEHFCWSEDGAEVIGLTPTGRASVIALRMNNEYIVPARRQWVIAGWHPPQPFGAMFL